MSTADGEIRVFRLFIVSFGKPVFVHDRQLTVNLPPVPDCHAPFFRSFKGGQIQGLQKSLGTGENASLTIQLVVCGVQTLDRVRRVDDGSHICGKLEDRSDDIPVSPSAQIITISLTPRFLRLLRTASQYLALSLSPTSIVRTSFFPSQLIPRMT